MVSHKGLSHLFAFYLFTFTLALPEGPFKTSCWDLTYSRRQPVIQGSLTPEQFFISASAVL